MKYRLETIPVWDAYNQQSECPLCLLQAKAERHYVDFFLGNSVMVPEMRIEVNKIGFCPRHFSLLLDGGNKLGLALITNTHLSELITKIKRMHQRLIRGRRGRSSSKKNLEIFSDFLKRQIRQCLICTRITGRLEHYSYTILHLWQHEEEFRAALRSSKGFCLPHIDFIHGLAARILPAKTLAAWIQELVPLEEKNLSRLEKELEFFAKKFDYQSDDIPWENSKDALPRALQKLTGRLPGQENR